MRIIWRKIYVGGTALLIVIAVYRLITFFQDKSSIELPQTTQVPSNTEDDSNDINKIGTIGVGTIEKARYVSFNKNKQVSREFGFTKLLHKQGDKWDIAEPFINLYQDNFDCKLTAKKGTVIADELEIDVDIKEAKLQGNVEINITPKHKTGIGQIDAFLNDVVFISDKSLFITDGPVKIISKDTQLLGEGMEIVYDYEKSRLDFLKIADLQSLCINQVQNQSLFASAEEQQQSSAPEDKSDDSNLQGKSAEKYRAVLSKNVKISTQDNMFFAKELLAIHNIIASGNSVENKEDTNSVTSSETSQAPGWQELMDVIITCDGGLVVNPMDNDIEQLGILNSLGNDANEPDFEKDAFSVGAGSNLLWTTALDYDTASRQAVATGPAKIIYYVKNDSSQAKPDILTVTAEEIITYDYNKGLIYFEGDCLCTLITNKQNKPQKYTLKSPSLLVNLVQSASDKTIGEKAVILNQITARGGANISVFDINNDFQTASITAERIDYKPQEQQIITSGPSVLSINFIETKQAGFASQAEKLTVTANERIRYNALTNQITFEGNCYCEMFTGQNYNGRKYTLNSDSIMVELFKSNNRQTESDIEGIRRIEATGNATIKTYTQKDGEKLAEFSAHTIEYDQSKNLITAPGPSRLLIFTDAVTAVQNKADSPTTITAQEKTVFLLDSNQVIFKGDCQCSMIRVDSGVPRKYILQAPKVTVDIAGNNDSVTGFAGIKYLTAKDNAVITVTPLESITELAKFAAASIRYDALTETITANGPCDFSFYANDFMPATTLGAAVPVRVNAKENTKFLRAKNQLIFQGDCLCTMVRAKTDSENKYTLSANTITLDLTDRDKMLFAVSALQIDKITAEGELVHLSNVTTESNKLINFSKLKCRRIEYDTADKIFFAEGPGLITIDNSKIYVSQVVSEKVNFSKRCYAFLRDFENLSYNLETNHIKASNNQDKILADYFPVTEGQKEQQQIKASAGTIEIQLAQNTKGQNEISSLKAEGGITYEDPDNQFIGDTLLYDAKTSLVRANASKQNRCYLNGAIVDNIIYDINKGIVLNVDITDPGRYQLKK
ncbi:MAG: LPS export ABC transporter periplasmic protein LptC [Sedimentisphaerales bacterium]|nr:LPS export ABC transporter periplasmic protein LptC [Sedimentisphaerales bacterium]